MSTQQDIYSTGSKNRPPVLNKDNYVPWSYRILYYAKSQPNRKLIYNSIIHGPYVRRIIPELGDLDCEVPIAETFHEQTDEELTKKEVNKMEADDQGIQTILMDLLEDIYAVVDSYETAQEIWLRVQQMMKGSDVEVNELRAERLARTHDPLALMANSNNPYNYSMFHQDQSSFNTNYIQQPMPNPEDIIDPTNAMNMTHVLMAKAFKLNYSIPTNNNQRISLDPRNRQIAQLGVNLGQDRHMLIVVLEIANQNVNQNRNGNVVAARAEGNGNGNENNENQVRCYNCKRMGHLARNCTIRPMRRDAAYL
uniref:CCHC-type domain-containing protein n=1 Tax=Tanacetum cinerariifolium TaxID=118510 RepID=A0A6L2K4B1_TANCI|nr:hypothetical protein [Tanacetum cinerariifolium]